MISYDFFWTYVYDEVYYDNIALCRRYNLLKYFMYIWYVYVHLWDHPDTWFAPGYDDMADYMQARVTEGHPLDTEERDMLPDSLSCETRW